MEIIRGWCVVRMVKTAGGRDRQENLSRIFASRETALICARRYGGGAYIQTVTAHTNDAMRQLC